MDARRTAASVASRCTGPILCALALCTPTSAAPQACSTLVPDGPTFRVHQNPSYTQLDARVDMTADGSLVAVAWSSGQDVWLRLFDGAGTPITADIFVIDTLHDGHQDEPGVAIDEVSGRILVAWSDFQYDLHDGDGMAIYGRIFDLAGNPLSGDLQIPIQWQASQWRPLVAAMPGGGWAVSWTSDWDGNSYVGVYDANGTSLTGDIRLNDWGGLSQIHPGLAVAPDGTILAAFKDSTAYGNVAGGHNVWARAVTAAGAFVGPAVHVAGELGEGDQKWAFVAADAQGNYVVVWEDTQNDGAGWGIFGRMFDTSGLPTGAPFRVNETTAGDQRRPHVDMDAAGNFVVAWESTAGGSSDVVVRRFDVLGRPTGPELVVHEATAGDQVRGNVALDAAGDRLVVIWDGPGDGADVFARFFDVELTGPTSYCTPIANSTGQPARIAVTGSLSVSANQTTLVATQAPPQQSGLFIYSPDPAEVPLGNGTLCVGSQTLGFVLRLPPTSSDAGGVLTHALDLTSPSHPAGQVTAGSTWFFSCWFRDVPAGGAGFNFSDGIAITFCP